MKSIPIRYAIVIFIITVAWTLLEHFLGFNTTRHEIGQYTRQVTAFAYYATVVMAIGRVRKDQGKLLTFGQGMQTGLYCCLTYSVLVTLWFALYAEVINPQFQSTLLAFTRRKMEASFKTPEQIEKVLKMERLSSGGSVASYLMLFGFMLAFGLMVSAIASAIMRKGSRRPSLQRTLA